MSGQNPWPPPKKLPTHYLHQQYVAALQQMQQSPSTRPPTPHPLQDVAPRPVAAPIRAVRAFCVTDTPKGPRLRPITMHESYPFYDPKQNAKGYRAKCMYAHAGEHKAPRPTCACGFYAIDKISDRLAGVSVIAEVELWGTICRHHHGYRAEYMRIVSLSVDKSFYISGSFKNVPRLIDQLSKSYGVPCKTHDSLGWYGYGSRQSSPRRHTADLTAGLFVVLGMGAAVGGIVSLIVDWLR